MPNTVLDVREVPNLLIAKFRSSAVSWREESGALVFLPVNGNLDYAEGLALNRRLAAFERLKKIKCNLPDDFDYKKERLKRLEEKYGSID